MTRGDKRTRDALVRMRAAFLDLQSAQRYTEANDLLELIERIEPPSATDGEAVGSTASRQLGPARSAVGVTPPVTSAPATWTSPSDRAGDVYVRSPAVMRRMPAAHCTTHLLPCCPGSLMHGTDEGTWTPTTAHR